jgi:hypothetical protein
VWDESLAIWADNEYDNIMAKPKMLATLCTLKTENMWFRREVRHFLSLPPASKIFKEQGKRLFEKCLAVKTATTSTKSACADSRKIKGLRNLRRQVLYL